MIKQSELIINPDGSIYHLKLRPEDIATTIITVGDVNRVDEVTKYFDSIELTRQNREFKTVTGSLGNKRLSVIATGIGTDNIDIVFNELDALVNIDFETREIKSDLTQLTFVRIGTSGTLRDDIPVDSLLLSEYAVDLGNLSSYYDYHCLAEAAAIQTTLGDKYSVIPANQELFNAIMDDNFLSGTTLTAPGFYAPQGRQLRLKSNLPDLSAMAKLKFDNTKITNLEMETAGIYLLSHLMEHRALSCNAILANRINGEFSKQPQQTIEKLINKVLDKVAKLA